MALPLREGLKDGGKDREGVLMKKLLLLGVIVVLLSFALVMVSCGNKCSGGATSGGADKCVWDPTAGKATICEDGTDCNIYSAAAELKTTKVECNCSS
jgi:hypothetical protein